MEPVAGRPAISAIEEVPIETNEELASLVIPSSRASSSIGGYEAQRSACPPEMSTVTLVGNTMYAGTVRRVAASTDAEGGPILLNVKAEYAAPPSAAGRTNYAILNEASSTNTGLV